MSIIAIQNQVDLEVPYPINVGQLKAFIIKNYPQTEAFNFAVAVEEVYADELKSQ